MMTIDIGFFKKFPMDLHMKAFHLNHWLLSSHEFKYLHYTVTLLSWGRNKFFGVCSDLDLCDLVYFMTGSTILNRLAMVA